MQGFIISKIVNFKTMHSVTAECMLFWGQVRMKKCGRRSAGALGSLVRASLFVIFSLDARQKALGARPVGGLTTKCLI